MCICYLSSASTVTGLRPEVEPPRVLVQVGGRALPPRRRSAAGQNVVAENVGGVGLRDVVQRHRDHLESIR
jgi:hypothetical protein